MMKKTIAVANLLVILYLVASHEQWPHKWELLLVAAVAAAVFLVRSAGASGGGGAEPGKGRNDHGPG